ncbi:hypothetical protein AMECASPLE_000322 [Ameca splendens]|uniref:Uncharacterized protein n=1 Tax=Ameca splendens TaxID=208324 RepID=A0ABV0ZHF9_9TELE
MKHPPHPGHQLGQTLLWDGIPFSNQHLSHFRKCRAVDHCGMTSTTKLILHMFSGVATRRNLARAFGKFFIDTTHILNSAPQSTSACFLQLWHHLRGNKQAFQ